MLSILLVISILLLLIAIASMLLLLRKGDGVQSDDGRLERMIRDEFERSREGGDKASRQLREEVAGSLAKTSETLATTMKTLGSAQSEQLITLQASNEKKLEEIRHTVDEKLQGTLEKRLGESFTQVSKRLEEVHRGLGEMKDLADGVGDLKRVLSNVQARGAWGEVQLRAILEQILNVEQYDENVETVPASGKRVEFAVRLPGPGDGRIEQVWLPIDSKFPMDSYARLQDAFESADAEAVATERKNLSNAVLVSAKDIRNKYVAPPHTTDIGILFLPVEGLYGEVLRDPRLLQELQSLRIVPAGPTTLAAMLSAFQMGFRTIAIEQRSAEVRSLLGKVKNEFEKFEAVLASLEKQLSTAQKTIEEKMGRRIRVMGTALKSVDSLPGEQSEDSPDLPGLPATGDETGATTEEE
ncbi:MAG: DNA recombination protein RmuC [Phycisphaerae bacterium]|nr:DNA recombination protein RmuC [Phycisphaerae bacterium]